MKKKVRSAVLDLEDILRKAEELHAIHCYITIPLLRVKRLQTQANFTRLRFQLLKVM